MRAFRLAPLRGLFAVLAALLVGMTTASAASAVTAHHYTRSFGTGGSGKLGAVGGIVARSTTDVFVADPTGLVRRYDQSGDPISGGIDTSATLSSPVDIAYYKATSPANAPAYLYVLGSDLADGSPVIAKYNLAGGAPTFVTLSDDVASVSHIAVDTTGQLYVGDNSAQLVRVYSATGAPLGDFDGTENGGQRFNQLDGLSIDSNNTVYVTETNTRVQKYSKFNAGSNPKTGYQGTLPAPNPRTLAVDRATNDVYVTDSPDAVVYGVTRYNALGSRQERFAEGADAGNFSSFSFSTGGNVFAGNRTIPSVDVYQPYTAPDAVTDDPPADITSTTATLKGSVNPRGNPTSYQFEYGTDTNYATKTDLVDAGNAANLNVDAAAPVASLVPNTTYHYRVVAITGNDRNPGEDRTFTTAAAPPTVSGESATGIAFNSATLNATVNNNNGPGPNSAYFEYGLDTTYGTTTTATDTSGSTLTASIQNLQPNTEYHYRVVASNGVGQGTVGGDQTFTTAPAPPVAAAAQATAVAGDSAQFSGTVDTQGLAGKVSFLVAAKNSPYAAVSAVQDLPAADGSRPVTGSVSGLPAGGVFEVRVRIETSTGTVLSDPATFSTASLATLVVSPPLAVDPFPYGCAAPRLVAPTKTLKAGRSVTLTGSDLGVTGTVAFGSRNAEVTDYSSTRVTVVVPSAASGRVPVTLTCGRVSNTVTARVSNAAPSNRFSTSTSTKKTTATVKVKVPGRGAVSVSGKQIGRKSAKPSKAGTTTLKVALTKSGRAALAKAKSKRLSVKVAVRYRPSGGSTRTAYRTLVFRR